jgi:predicted nucleic acid-binding Zn ribbon protein
MEGTVPIATIDCPYCSEPINAKSKKCKHCGEILDPQMREIEQLKRQQFGPQVFMNAGGAAAAAAASGVGDGLRRFPHAIHIILVLLTGLIWLPIYILLYVFRNRRYYY